VVTHEELNIKRPNIIFNEVMKIVAERKREPCNGVGVESGAGEGTEAN